MRLFTGIDLPTAVVRALDELLDRLRPTARIKWSPPANLHVTTRFIGEWPEARLPELRAALAALPSHPPIPIQIRNLGYFPNPKSPRVFWAGVEASPDLAALGLEPEKRGFSPHLTLARVKDPVPLAALRQAVAALPSAPPVPYTRSLPSFRFRSERLFHRIGRRNRQFPAECSIEQIDPIGDAPEQGDP